MFATGKSTNSQKTYIYSAQVTMHKILPLVIISAMEFSQAVAQI